MKKLSFLKILFSPFKRFKLEFYFGRVAIGTPYFFPRKFVRISKKEAHVKTQLLVELRSNADENQKKELYERLYNTQKNMKKSVPKLIGFDFTPLGWKLKWDDNDFRHEYNPVWSFVFFGFQIAVRFHAPIEHQDSYWTAWLYYELRTAKILTKAERIKQCRKRFPVTYMVKQDSGYVETDYYQQILKPKYL